MNRPVHSAAAQQRSICRIHDGVDLLFRDVALNHRYGFVVHLITFGGKVGLSPELLGSFQSRDGAEEGYARTLHVHLRIFEPL